MVVFQAKIKVLNPGIEPIKSLLEINPSRNTQDTVIPTISPDNEIQSCYRKSIRKINQKSLLPEELI